MKQINELSYFSDYLEKKLYSKSTINTYSYALIDFFKYLDTINLDYHSFCNKNVLDFIEKLKGSNTEQTINSKIYSITKYVEFLEKRKNIRIPLILAPLKIVNKKPVKPISDINVILKYIDEIEKNKMICLRDKLLISMIYYCGLRTMDVLKIKVRDLNKNELTINDKKTLLPDDIVNKIKKLASVMRLKDESYIFYNFSPGRLNQDKKHLTEKSAQSIFNKYKIVIDKSLSIRDLRSSFSMNIENYILSIDIISISDYSEFVSDCDYLSFKNKIIQGK